MTEHIVAYIGDYVTCTMAERGLGYPNPARSGSWAARVEQALDELATHFDVATRCGPAVTGWRP